MTRFPLLLDNYGMISWGVFPDGMTGLSCNWSQSLSVLVTCTLLFYKILRGISFL